MSKSTNETTDTAADAVCNHVAPGRLDQDSEYICRRPAGHTGSHSEDHNVTRMNELSEASKRAGWVEFYRNQPTSKLIAFTTSLRIRVRRGHGAESDADLRLDVLEAEQARRSGIGHAVNVAHEQALAIESLSGSTVPNLVGAMEWALKRIGTHRERPWMWDMVREMEWALNARGFETVPDQAHEQALSIERA